MAKLAMSQGARRARLTRATKLAVHWHETTERLLYGHRVTPWDRVPEDARQLMAEAFRHMIEDGYIKPRRITN